MEISLWVCFILESGVFSVSLPEITDGKFIDECVKEHNRARSSVSPPASDMLYMVGKPSHDHKQVTGTQWLNDLTNTAGRSQNTVNSRRVKSQYIKSHVCYSSVAAERLEIESREHQGNKST